MLEIMRILVVPTVVHVLGKSIFFGTSTAGDRDFEGLGFSPLTL